MDYTRAPEKDRLTFRFSTYHLLTRGFIFIPLQGREGLSDEFISEMGKLVQAWGYFNLTYSEQFKKIMPEYLLEMDIRQQLVKLIPETFHTPEGKWKRLADNFIRENFELICQLIMLIPKGKLAEDINLTLFGPKDKDLSQKSFEEVDSEDSTDTLEVEEEIKISMVELRQLMKIVSLILTIYPAQTIYSSDETLQDLFEWDHRSKLFSVPELKLALNRLTGLLILFIRKRKEIYQQLYDFEFDFSKPREIVDLVASDMFDDHLQNQMIKGCQQSELFDWIVGLRGLGENFIGENYLELKQMFNKFKQYL